MTHLAEDATVEIHRFDELQHGELHRDRPSGTEDAPELTTWQPLALLPPDATVVPLDELLQLQALRQELDDCTDALRNRDEELQALAQQMDAMREQAQQEGFAHGLQQLLDAQRAAHLHFEDHYAAELQKLALQMYSAAAHVLGDVLREHPADFAAMIAAQAFPDGRKFQGLRIQIPAIDELADELRRHTSTTPNVVIELDPRLHDTAVIDHDAGRIVCDPAALLDAFAPRQTSAEQP